MKLQPSIFVALYERIYKKGLLTERNNVPYPGAKKELTRKLWSEKGKEKDTRTFFQRYFTGFANGKNDDYFYRIYNDCLTRVKSVNIDDLSLYRAFKYIGYKHDQILDDDLQDASVFNPEVRIWIVQFIRDNATEINAAELRKNEKINTPAIRFEPMSPEADIKISNGQPLTDKEGVEYSTRKFYNAIGLKDYKLAWEQLTPSFQQRVWKGVYERFEEGYVNNNGLRNIHVFHIVPRSENTMDCQVYYEDEVIIHTTSELNAIAMSTVKDIRGLVKNVKKLKEKVEAAGGKDFDKLELYKLLEPTAADYIWYTCKIPQERVGDIFHVAKLNIVKRVLLVTCQKIGKNWLIESIRALKTYSLR